MNGKLQGKKFAILVTDGFEQVEMTEPRQALIEAGAAVDIVSPNSKSVQGFHHDKKGNTFDVTVWLEMADPIDYDGLVLPGGVLNPDQLRQDQRAIEFVKAIADARKPIAAICHGPWTLIEAGAVKGRRMTSWPSLRSDLINAGANWVDQEVVVDQGLVTSRKPADLPAFCDKMVEEFAEGKHGGIHRLQPPDQPGSGINSLLF